MYWSGRRIAFLLCFAALTCGGHAGAAQTVSPKAAAHAAAAPAKPSPILPDAFAGWEADGTLKIVTDAAQADPANATALGEYAFTTATLASYKRAGETLGIRALRFHDASGAYGAYSFYRHDGWPKEEIGTGATSDHNRVLFWLGNTVVDANFSHLGPMSGSELRELASHIELPNGSKGIAPPILANLPKASLDPQTTHYAVGPAGYTGAGGVLPAALVGFDKGAETATASYNLRSGPATLTVIDYPTPQMAAAQESKIRDYIKAGSKALPPWPKPLMDSDLASLEVRRSGPLVVLVSGDAVPDESHKLISLVNFQADLVSIPQPTESEVAKTGRLLLGIAGIVIVGSFAAILLGFFLGGGRALYRIARGKPASSMYDEEFTSLNLHE